jgi:DNA polymerase-3 subunit alpha
MHTAEDLGLVKCDLLGLRTLDIIYDVLEYIGKDYEYIAPHNINFEDPKVFENFRQGNTSAIFQFESDGMKGTLKDINCNSLYDLSVANALYRPGSMDYIKNYADRRSGKEQFEYLHDDLIPILKDCYGIIVFQEQLIEIGRLAALSNPDELRQATAKKKPKLMEKIKPELINGLKQRGWSQDQVEELWETILKFAKYSFNRSHSLAYAMMAYICMFLKIYHPVEFVTAWINSYHGKIDKIPECYAEANRLKIHVKIPSYGRTFGTTTYDKKTLLIGTESIKYLNKSMADELNRLAKMDLTFIELLQQVKSINTKQIQILIHLDYFKQFGKAHKLLKFYEIYLFFKGRKEFSKNEEYPAKIETIRMFCKKETAKTYSEFQEDEFFKYLWDALPDKDISLKEKIKAQYEYLGYIFSTDENVKPSYWFVLDISNKYKNYILSLHNIKTGEQTTLKLKKKYYDDVPVQKLDIIQIDAIEEDYCWYLDENKKWKQNLEKKERLLTNYKIV